MKCFICNKELSPLELSFAENFQEYEEGKKMVICSDCAYKINVAYLIDEELQTMCSVCGKNATKKIQVLWKGKEFYFPRCDKHIIKGYKGKVIKK